MKVGLVGCGRIATAVHLPSLKKIEGYDLVAAADTHPARLLETNRRFGVDEAYSDYRQMLVKADIDAVFVCTPPQHHFQIVMDSIEWGKHVFCEKPLATTLEEALAIKRALKMKQQTSQEQLTLMPAHNFIFTPCFTETLKLVKRGEIGKIRKIRGKAVSNLRFYRAKTDFRTQAKGGVIEDELPHTIYLCHRIGGPLDKISCVKPNHKGGTVSLVEVEAKLRGDVEANMAAAWIGLVPTLKLEVIGEEGEVTLDLLRTPYNVTLVKDGEAHTTNMGKGLRQYIDVFRSRHPSYENEHRHFLDCVKKGAQPQVTVDDGVQLVNTLSEVIAHFEGKTSATSTPDKTVVVLRVSEDVAGAVKKSVDMLGGLNVRDNDTVIVKPNICHPKNLENMVTTDLRILEAVLKMAKQKTNNVLVVESDSMSGTAEKRAASTGAMDMIRKCDTEFFNLSQDDFVEHDVNGLELKIPKTVLKADFLINLPKLKTCVRSSLLLSGAMKNMFGLLPDKKSRFHKRLAEVLVYLNRTLRQDLIIMDGIVGMEGLGPIQGKPVNLSLIISGKNPTTVDASCCHIVGFNPYAAKALWLANQQGMGELDLNKIHVLGENIESVRRPFSHPAPTTKNIASALKTELKLRFGK